MEYYWTTIPCRIFDAMQLLSQLPSTRTHPIAISATARLDPPSPNACHHHILCPRIATPRSTATAAYCEHTTLTAARLPPLRARTNRTTAAIPDMPAPKETMKSRRSLGKIRGPVERATEIAIRSAAERWSNRGKRPASFDPFHLPLRFGKR